MKLLRLLFLMGTVVPVIAESAWVPLAVDPEHEAETTQRLEAAGIPTISWSSAVVEVSDFEPLALRPLAHLGLTEDDPRWDPWLRGLEKVFRPDRGTSLVWVEAPREAEARSLTGASPQGHGEQLIGPRLVTGWTLLFLGLLWGALRLFVALSSASRSWRSWTWVGGLSAILALGLVLVFTGTPRAESPRFTVSWFQHRWFQESWPYGARWEDWKPGEAWSYPSVERQDGRLVPVSVILTRADEAWARAAWESLDPRHPARLFGPENP